LLSPSAILRGKLGASLSFVFLLIVATVPLISVSFLLGGVTVGVVLRGLAMLVLIALMLACVALLASTLLRRTQRATVATYGVVAFLMLGTFMIYACEAVLQARTPNETGSVRPNRAVLVLNPMLAISDVVRGRANQPTVAGSPFSSMRTLTTTGPTFGTSSGRAVIVGGIGGSGSATFVGGSGGAVTFGSNGFVVSRPGSAGQASGSAGQHRSLVERIPFWFKSAFAFAWICAAAFSLAVRRLRLPSSVPVA
jgi:hypothetical protein